MTNSEIKKIERNPKKFLKTYIKKNVKIGSNSTILPITVEENTVIGAGSVVTKNCKKNSVYLGNPAKKEMISVINYDGGNIKSILNILKRCNIDYYLTSKEKEIIKLIKIILPGVSSFDYCIKKLKETGLDEIIKNEFMN